MALALLGELRLQRWVFLWPLFLAILVLFRQNHAFRTRIDDIPHQQIAERTAKLTAKGWHQTGFSGALNGFFQGTALDGELPPHVNPNRPLIVWTWSAAYVVAGESGLQWTWRVLYLLTVLGLFFLISYLSHPVTGAVLAGAVAVAPVTQGLLAWMSASTYFLCYTLLLFGTYAAIAGDRSWHRALGLGMLFLSLFTRDVTYLLLPGSVALFLATFGRKRLAMLVVAFPILRWFCFQSETTSSFATLAQDFPLFARNSLLVLAVESASMVRNMGLLVLVPLLLFLVKKRWIRLCVGIGMVLAAYAHLLLLVLLLVFSCLRSKRAIPGSLWALIAMGSMCFYGHFSSRYAFEPLVGLCLAMAPAALPRPRLGVALVAIPLLLWHAVACLWPDTVYRPLLVSYAAEFADQRYRALDLVTQRRWHDRATFADRIADAWYHQESLRLVAPGDRHAVARVWRSDSFWIAGNTANLHCGNADLLLFNRRQLWEWNAWYWRVVPPEKERGVRIMTGEEGWSVFAGSNRRRQNIVWVVESPLPYPQSNRSSAVSGWLADIPELMHERRPRDWLVEIWENESGCSVSPHQSSFRELELGRLLLRDDGWLDVGELTYLRNRTRSRLTGHSA